MKQQSGPRPNEGTRRTVLAKAGLFAGGIAAAVLHGSDAADAQILGETVDIAPPAGDAALRLRPSGAVAPSTSVGGALNLDNSASRGAGAVLYSDQGADALGRLLVVNQANPANPQHAVRIQNSGTSHTVSILHDPAGGAGDSSAEALDIVSTNPLDTTLGVQGQEEGRGTVKITHEKPARADANAAAVSIALLGDGTACQGIFIGNDAGNRTTGKLLNIRNGGPGTDRLVLTADGHLTIAGQIVLTDVDKSVANANYAVAHVDPSTTIALADGGGLRGVALSAAVTVNGTLAPTSLSMSDLTTIVTPTGRTDLNAIKAYRCAPQINGLSGVAGGVTGSTFSSFQHEVRLRSIAGGTASFARVYGFYMPPWTNSVGAGWTIPMYSAVRIEAPGGEGQIMQLTGIDIRDFKDRATCNYSLRSFGCGVQMRHSGGVSLGAQAAPDTLLHLRGNAAVHGSITLDAESSHPPAPAAGSQARLYVKDGKLVVQYNAGGTVLYTSIPLDSPGPYPAAPPITTDVVAPWS